MKTRRKTPPAPDEVRALLAASPDPNARVVLAWLDRRAAHAAATGRDLAADLVAEWWARRK